MANIYRVSQSKVNTWRRCRRAYWYKYVEKLRRKRVSRPLKFGRIVHSMIEGYANSDDPMKVLAQIAKREAKMFRSQEEEWGDLIEDIRVIMTDYFEFHDPKSLTYIRMKGKSSEFTFEVEIANGILATGLLDNLGKAKGLRWLVEHKTFNQMPNDDHRWRNLQGALYLKINDMLKLPKLDGIVWDYIRSKPPSTPQILKNGQVSARALDTLPTRVREFAAENKLSLKGKYAQLIKSAEANRSKYFQRIFTPVKQKLVDTLFEDFVETAKEMKNLHGNVKERHIGRHCDWCEFEGLCRGELMGLDVKFIKAKEYEVSDYKGSKEEPDFEG